MTELRPRRGAAIGMIAAAALGAITLLADGLIRGSHPIVAAIPAVLFVGGVAVGAILVVSRSRLDFGHDVVLLRPAWGLRRELPTTSLTQIIIAPRVGAGLGRDLSVLVIMDAVGRPFARLNLARWNLADVIAATSHYRDRVTIVDERISRAQFTARYPNALPYGARHPNLTALWFLLGAFVFIFGIAALFETVA